MATNITGFGARGNTGGAADGWDHSYRGTLLAAQQSAQIVPSSPITGETVKIYTGWPAGNGDVTNASLVRNSSTNPVTLREYSWTLDYRDEDSSTTGNRNHCLQNCNLDWENGKFHIIGSSNSQRFGFGSPHANNRNSVTGRIVNTLFQCENVRFVMQLPGVAGGVLDGFALDDFTFGNARADIAFNQGTLIDGIETGTGDGTADTENGNYIGLFTDSTGITAPSVNTNEVIRREDNGSGQPAQQFWYSPKTTPLYSVDPVFRLRQSDGTFTDATVETHSDITTWLLVRGSSSTNTGQQAQTNSGWSVGFTLGVEPRNSIGTALAGTYWLLDPSDNTYSEHEYQITGVTDTGNFVSNGASRYDPITIDADNGITSGLQVYSITDEAIAASRVRTSQINFVDRGVRDIVTFVDGYDFFIYSNVNPRVTKGTQRPTMTPVSWLKAASATDQTWNEAAGTLYDFYSSDVLRLENRVGTWGTTHVTLTGSGDITHGTSAQSFDGSTWELGTLVAETATVNRTGSDLTTINTINATSWDLSTSTSVDLQGTTVNIDNFSVTGGVGVTVSNGTIDSVSNTNLSNVTIGEDLVLGGVVSNVGSSFSAGTSADTQLITQETSIDFAGAELGSGTTLALVGGGTINISNISADSLANLSAVTGTTIVVTSTLTVDGWEGDGARVAIYSLPMTDSSTPVAQSTGSDVLQIASGTDFDPGDNLRIVYSRPNYDHIISDITAPSTSDTVTLSPQLLATAFTGGNLESRTVVASYDTTSTLINFVFSGNTSKPRSDVLNRLMETVKGTETYNFALARRNQVDQVIYHTSTFNTQLLQDTYQLRWNGSEVQVVSNLFQRQNNGEQITLPVSTSNVLHLDITGGGTTPSVFIDSSDSGIDTVDFQGGVDDILSEIQDNAGVTEDQVTSIVRRLTIAASQL